MGEWTIISVRRTGSVSWPTFPDLLMWISSVEVRSQQKDQSPLRTLFTLTTCRSVRPTRSTRVF